MTVLERPRHGGDVRLYSGKHIWPLDPRPGDEYLIDFNDIAHMTEGESRFCSATQIPYPVALHCVYVARVVRHRLLQWRTAMYGPSISLED